MLPFYYIDSSKITLISSGFSFTCRQFAFLSIVLFIPHCLPWISRLSLEWLRKKKRIIFISFILLAAHLKTFPSLLCHPLFISLKLINASSPSYYLLVLVIISFDFCSKFSKNPWVSFPCSLISSIVVPILILSKIYSYYNFTRVSWKKKKKILNRLLFQPVVEVTMLILPDGSETIYLKAFPESSEVNSSTSPCLPLAWVFLRYVKIVFFRVAIKKLIMITRVCPWQFGERSRTGYMYVRIMYIHILFLVWIGLEQKRILQTCSHIVSWVHISQYFV